MLPPVRDELSVYFENPATDPMGYNHVEGRLFCGRDRVEIQYKQRDRAFRKNETTCLAFDYGEVARVEFVRRLFGPDTLVFQSRVAERLDEFPGSDVGSVALRVLPSSRKEAKRAASFIEYRQSVALLLETERRLGRGDDGDSL